jgi:hypothetical protein
MPAGPRIRDNNVFGTTTDNPLAAGATTFNSAGLAKMSVVAAAHAVVTLDPIRQFGEPEIVVVTVHTASATVATITRGQYGTVDRAHPQGTLWVHQPIDEDFIEVLTSITRPSNPYEGQFIFETNTNKLVGFGGVDWAPRDAGGQLGSSQAIANQTGISTTIVDLTNLSTIVTVSDNRRIHIEGVANFVNVEAAQNGIQFFIREGSTQIKRTLYVAQAAGAADNADFISGHVSIVFAPSAGSHTYKLSAQATGASFTLSASATDPAFILVTDIGAA